MPAIWILSVGGKSFQMKVPDEKQSLFVPRGNTFDTRTNRRGIYMARGYIPSTDVMANFLLSFDVDDGRAPCPVRGQTVTAPQALFTMNDKMIEAESAKFAERMLQESSRRPSCGGESGVSDHAGPRADRRAELDRASDLS